jgi:asparagine synthase (glutamine-hydrolysing)
MVDTLPESLSRRTLTQYAGRFLRSAEADPVERYAHFTCYSLGPADDPVWDGPVPDDALRYLRAAFQASDGPTRTDRLMDVDMETYLPDDLLVKVDRASMAHSLELRSPFLDHEVVEFAARIPAKYKWRRGTKKWLLKRAFDDLLPDDILSRRKQGFGVPLDEWFRADLRAPAREALERLGTRPGFDRRGARSVLADHVADRADNGFRLWHLLMLERWYERFIDAES